MSNFEADAPGRLVVLGAGESGAGAAILGKVKGWDVFVSDYGKIAPRYAAMLDSEEIPWEQGGHDMERILAADLVVKSPGIADSTPVMRAVIGKGIPVVSEIEFAGRYSGARMICITGSNGKTTTTLLTHHILSRAGLNPGLAGNVGRSLALQVARDPKDLYVIELSSFQLDNMYDFRADVAVIMNITPDHMDRYDHKMQNYVDAKFRILRNMTPEGAFIYLASDPVITAQPAMATTPAQKLPFAASDTGTPLAAQLADGMMCVAVPGAEPFTMPRADLALPGLHNLYNSMAAALIALSLGVDHDTLRSALADFSPVEHRLEPAGVIDGVRWINDSKATNVDSTWYALESMPDSRSTVLILGGTDKGNDYSAILPFVKRKVKAIVAMGVDNAKIVDFFSGRVPVVESTSSLADAVSACRRLSAKGDTVLLSPCCASFDLFKNYEDRGRLFKEAVAALAN